MGGAKRYPSMPKHVAMGIASLHPSYDITSRSRGLMYPSFASRLPSSKSEGAGKTGCLLHPRSRVRFAQTKLHTSIQGSGSIPAFPAQWLYGLLRALVSAKSARMCERAVLTNRPSLDLIPFVLKGQEPVGERGTDPVSSSTRTVAWASSPDRARKGVDDGTKRSSCRRY